MRNQNGFTLIEALVASMISIVIPGTLIVLLTTSNRQLGDGASKMRLSQVATGVSEEFHAAGLSAAWVYGRTQLAGATTDCPAAPPQDHISDQMGLAFCNSNRRIFKAFRVQSPFGSRSILDSYDSINGWKPMVFGGDTVKVSLNPDNYSAGQVYREGGLFGIGSLGAWAYVNFHFDMEISGTRYSLPLQMQSVLCRNAPSRMPLSPW